jgi:hypothetical protein
VDAARGGVGVKKCSGCGREIARGEDYYQQITAWVANQKRDSVTLRKDVIPPRYACRACITKWQYGISDAQEALL